MKLLKLNIFGRLYNINFRDALFVNYYADNDGKFSIDDYTEI